MELLNMQFSSVSYSSLFGPNILLSALFSDTSQVFFLNVRDQVSRPFKATGKIILVVYILIFTFLVSRREDKTF
jgi:hypothetical protein